MTRHSKELALNDREFELLLEGTRRMEEYYGQQARFAIYAAGRLGLRAGEVAHFREDWVNWRTRRIEIPADVPCEKGKDGGICGYCRQAAKQMVEYNAISAPEARLELLQDGVIKGFRPDTERQLLVAHRRHADGDITEPALDEQVDTILTASTGDEWEIYEALVTEGESLVADQDITLAEAEAEMWRPKTDAAVREVPFDWSPRAELSIERFCDRYDGWPLSRSALARRVATALQEADELTEETTHCHGLRATAATHIAGRGISTLTLQSYMGWAQASTARVYVRAAPDKTQRELLQTTGR